MTRSEMLALLREVRAEGEFNDWPELDKAIAWLERLPAGCELGPICKCHWEAGDSPCPLHGEEEGEKSFLEKMKEVASVVEGMPDYAKAGINLSSGQYVTYLGDDEQKLPDDLTKAGNPERRCPRHGSYKGVCQECLNEQRGKR